MSRQLPPTAPKHSSLHSPVPGSAPASPQMPRGEAHSPSCQTKSRKRTAGLTLSLSLVPTQDLTLMLTLHDAAWSREAANK